MPQNAFHLSLNVANLEYSVGFYRLVFGVDPAKWFPDYAKFELSEPNLVLALEPAKVTPGGNLNHIGIRVSDRSQIDGYEMRLKQVGVAVQRITDIECCYSRQSKIVFRDPDQNLFEVYTLEGDSSRRAAETRTPSVNTSAAILDSWEHLVGMPYSAPAKEGKLSEVRLRGSFNHQNLFDNGSAILADARAALRPGGQLLVHLLVANQPMEHALPPLPPPADQVKFVPTESKVVSLIEKSGFGYVQIVRLSHAPVMRLGNCELRELLIHAKSPYESYGSEKKSVVYKGPFKKLEDDRGRTFERGERVALAKEEIAYLESQGWLNEFVVLD